MEAGLVLEIFQVTQPKKYIVKTRLGMKNGKELAREPSCGMMYALFILSYRELSKPEYRIQGEYVQIFSGSRSCPRLRPASLRL